MRLDKKFENTGGEIKALGSRAEYLEKVKTKTTSEINDIPIARTSKDDNSPTSGSTPPKDSNAKDAIFSSNDECKQNQNNKWEANLANFWDSDEDDEELELNLRVEEPKVGPKINDELAESINEKLLRLRTQKTLRKPIKNIPGCQMYMLFGPRF